MDLNIGHRYSTIIRQICITIEDLGELFGKLISYNNHSNGSWSRKGNINFRNINYTPSCNFNSIRRKE
jgi:hypothetical protein